MVKHEDERAFPVTMVDGRGESMTNLGMTLRDYFAANATDEDVLDVRHVYYMNNGDKPDFVALTQTQARYMFADAMLAERAK